MGIFIPTAALRIGPRYDVICADLTSFSGIIQYVQSLKYLGICIKKFVCDFDRVKTKFYRKFNCIDVKSFTGNPELITIELLRRIAYLFFYMH